MAISSVSPTNSASTTVVALDPKALEKSLSYNQSYWRGVKKMTLVGLELTVDSDLPIRNILFFNLWRVIWTIRERSGMHITHFSLPLSLKKVLFDHIEYVQKQATSASLQQRFICQHKDGIAFIVKPGSSHFNGPSMTTHISFK